MAVIDNVRGRGRGPPETLIHRQTSARLSARPPSRASRSGSTPIRPSTRSTAGTSTPTPRSRRILAILTTTAEGTLTGTISGFMQDGQSIGSGWKVELGAAPDDHEDAAFDPMMPALLSRPIETASPTPKTALWAPSGTRRPWGPGTPRSSTTAASTRCRAGVTGTFHVGQEGHPINMVGAFAASNQEADAAETTERLSPTSLSFPRRSRERPAGFFFDRSRVPGLDWFFQAVGAAEPVRSVKRYSCLIP